MSMENTTARTLMPTILNSLDPLDVALAGYLARFKNENTFRQYSYHLKVFVTWCQQHRLHALNDITRAHIEFYVRYLMEERGWKASTVNSAMAPIKGFYDFAVWDEHIVKDPARRVALPKYQYKKVAIVPSRDMAVFFETAKAASPRHWCLVVLLSSMALRISEAASIRIENYRGLEAGIPVIGYREKGGNWRESPVPMPVMSAIELARGGRTEGPLLTQLDGVSPLSRSAATGLVETVNRRARKDGLKRHINPHLLRKMAITEALEMNMSIRDVQEFARHADPRTTSRHYDLGRANHHRHPVHQIAARLAI